MATMMLRFDIEETEDSHVDECIAKMATGAHTKNNNCYYKQIYVKMDIV